MCKVLFQKQGVHSVNAIHSAEFHYTDDGDTVRCDTCGLEVSGWTSDMKPFTIHEQRSPACSFVRSLRPTDRVTVPFSSMQSISALNDGERSSKRQKIEVT